MNNHLSVLQVTLTFPILNDPKKLIRVAFYQTDSGELQKLEVPRDSVSIFNDQNAYITLKSDWKRHNSIYNVGSLLKIPVPNSLAENCEPVVILTLPKQRSKNQNFMVRAESYSKVVN